MAHKEKILRVLVLPKKWRYDLLELGREICRPPVSAK